MTIEERLRDASAEVIALRRHFHRHPELSWKEFETQKAIINHLRALDIPYETAAGTGVIAELKGGKTDGRVLGIRADIDALPVKEDTDLRFSSEKEGISHACGHDTHIAMALTAATVLAGMKEDLPVTVRFIFQPAEETPGNSGADRMLDHPLVSGCDRMIAIHTWSKIPAGKAGLCTGPVMASTDTFDVHIEGKGGHGAVPHETVDPIPAAAEFIQSVQRVVSRETDPFETAVITIGSVHAGTTWNVIPDCADLMGTARAYSAKIADAFPSVLSRIAEGVGTATGTKITVRYHKGPLPVINDPEVTETAKRVAESIFGKENVIPWRQMVGEDFANYHAPKCLLFLGGGFPAEEERWPQHSPHYVIDESVLIRGVEYFVRYVFAYGAEK